MEKIELRTVEKEKLRKFFKPLDSKKMIKLIVAKEMVQYESRKKNNERRRERRENCTKRK